MIHTSRQLKDLVRNLSLKSGIEAQALFRKYMMERFLERLAVSKYNQNFILKGGLLVSSFVGDEAIKKLWNVYCDKFTYVNDFSWEEVMTSVCKLSVATGLIKK